MRRHPSLSPLSHPHQHGWALSVLIERGLKPDSDRNKVLELRRQALTLAEVELDGHFQVEEEIVFPAVEEALQSDELVNQLVDQHREMEALVERIRESSGEAVVEALIAFGDVLRKHIRLEERHLFEQLQEAISEAEIEELGVRIESDLSKVCPSTQTLPWEAQDEAAR